MVHIPLAPLANTPFHPVSPFCGIIVHFIDYIETLWKIHWNT